MKKSDYILFLNFIIGLLHQRGLEARDQYLADRQARKVKAAAFSDGYVVGYYHCLDTLLSQAELWGMPMDQVNPGIDPKDLMSMTLGE